jgi:hypothetical protein
MFVRIAVTVLWLADWLTDYLLPALLIDEDELIDRITDRFTVSIQYELQHDPSLKIFVQFMYRLFNEVSSDSM